MSVKLKVDKDGNAEITEGADSFIGKMIAGAKGKIKLRSPLIKEKQLKVVKKLPKPKDTEPVKPKATESTKANNKKE